LKAVDPIPAPDFHVLRAAEGWLELGNSAEASLELDKLSSITSGHPDVLNLRWQINQQAKKWDACLVLARANTESSPNDPRGWIALAQTFYFQELYQEAYDIAVSKITRFPKHWPLYYDAACYACLTGRLEQAKQFLQLAMVCGDATDVRLRALKDPDLQNLWTGSDKTTAAG
jgi:predicted Zn-dependent protease